MARALTYHVTIQHDGLGVIKVVRGRDRYVVELMAQAQLAKWDEQWKRKQEQHRKASSRRAAQEHVESMKEAAAELTSEAGAAIQAAEGILAATLDVDDAIDWESLKDRRRFTGSEPARPVMAPLPSEPYLAASQPSFFARFLEMLDAGRKAKRIEADEVRMQSILADWKDRCEALQRDHATAVAKWEKALERYTGDKQAFEAALRAQHASIDEEKARWQAKDPIAVEEYCQMVLTNSRYPDWVPPESDVMFNGDTGVLLVEFQLPLPEDLPRIKEVKFVKAKDSLQESFISDAALEKLYEAVCYQLALRTVHELFEADRVAAIGSIIFNGYIDGLDPATGKPFKAVILSFQAPRAEFLDVDLRLVDPKACVRKFKGVAATKLRTLTPIAPIARLDRSDERFVEGKDVLEGIDEGFDLGAMDWGDFEHLVRQLFEKEFGADGAEVKVTQASRDGGVDAIAFDPDPIRGGKFVIQAKRYSKVVPVSAVRDLYGTVMNEGAVKGILVTTAHFGSDAYTFAQGKPITLLDGSNLLAMLAKHGTKATIKR